MTSIRDAKAHLLLTLTTIVVGAVIPSAGAYQRPGSNEMVSRGPQGRQIQYFASDPGVPRDVDISADGRFVAFSTDAQELVPNDSNGLSDVFVYDRRVDRLEIVSRSNRGDLAAIDRLKEDLDHATMDSDSAAISGNGRYVVFRSGAPLSPDDTDDQMDIYLHDRKKRRTTLVTAPEPLISGKENCDPSGIPVVDDNAPEILFPPVYDVPSISGNGRHITYSGLFGGETRSQTAGLTQFIATCTEIFVYDRQTRLTRRVSGVDGPSASRESCSSISANGRYVVFTAYDPKTDVISEEIDVYVRDLRSKGVELISQPVGRERMPQFPVASNACTEQPISADGRYVAFSSELDDLVPNDTYRTTPLGGSEVFVRDRLTDRIVRVLDSTGREGLTTGSANISGNGRYVFFEGRSPAEADLEGVCPPTQQGGSFSHAFDLATGALECLGVSFDGGPLRDPGQQGAVGNGNGRYVAFASASPNVVRVDTNDWYDVFVRDRGLPLTVGALASSGRAQTLELEGTGSFASTGIASLDDPDDREPLLSSTDLLGASFAYRPALEDFYVVLEINRLPQTPVLAAATAGHVYVFSFSIDQERYELRAVSTGIGPRRETTASFGLFRCPSRSAVDCRKVMDVPGGFGTSGHRITFTMPTDELALKSGSTFRDVTAFTALGSLHGGPTEVLDRAQPTP